VSLLAGTLLLAATAAAVPEAAETAAPVAFDRRWLEPHFAAGPLRAPVERFRLDDFAGAAAGLERALARLPKSSPERAPGRFLLGLARMSLTEWTAAGAIFEELHQSYPLLAPYHAYHAARCRLRRGDTAGALTWADRVPAGTVPEAETLLIKIDAYAALGRWSDVDAEAARFLERFPAGPRRAEASFRRAEALERLGRPPAEAAALYRRIWSEAPLETWAARAEERLAALAAGLSEAEAARARTATAADWVARGMALFEKNQNVESEAAFTAALAATGLTPNLACEAAFHRAQSVFKQRQRPRAAPLFAEAEPACRAAGDRDLTVKALYQGARCVASAGDRAAARARYAQIEADFADHSYADDARLRAAELASDDGRPDEAAALLEQIPARYPQGDQLGEALWRLAFGAIQASEFAAAHAWLDENLRRVPRETIWYAEGRALYWKGRVHELEGRRDEARALYTRAVREYPLSVYAFLALERMRKASPRDRAALLAELRAGLARPGAPPPPPVVDPRPRAAFGAPGFRRAVELARLGLGGEARRELAKLDIVTAETRDAARRAGPPAPEQEEIQWLTALLLDRGRVWSASHAIPRYTLTSFKQAWPAGRREGEWRLAFPKAYPELVTAGSRGQGVPEPLLYAIMREESAFNPRIESFANALGLTQLLVRTAQRFAPGRVTRETLLDPAQNVQIGSRVLGFLLDHFGGQVPLAIAGYNAGEAAVDRWLRDSGHLELDAFLEKIPYDETRGYTKRVLASYFTYSWLYAREAPVPALAFSLKPEPRREHAGRPPAMRPEARRPRP
jgi:soluble lytic murein transglycosylase